MLISFSDSFLSSNIFFLFVLFTFGFYHLAQFVHHCFFVEQNRSFSKSLEVSRCVKFNPVYNNVAKKYSDKYKFLKVNAKTAEGYSLMKRFNAEFVPFVVLINTKTNEAANISPGCLLKLACTERVINDFFK